MIYCVLVLFCWLACAQAQDLQGDPLPPGALARLGTLRFRHSAHVYGLAFGPGGRALASCSDDSTLALWEFPSGRPLRLFHGEERGMYCLAIAPDGKTLAAGAAGGIIRLWDIESGKLRLKLEDEGNMVNALAFSADGRTLACAVDSTLIMRDAANGKQILRIRGDADSLFDVAWSVDGKTLASAGKEAVRVWDAAGRELASHKGRACAVSFAPNGRLVATAREKDVALFDARTLKLVRALETDTTAMCVTFTPDGSLVAFGGEDGAVRLFEAETGKERARLLGHSKDVDRLAFAPDGRTLVSCGKDRTIRFWDVATCKERPRENPGTIHTVAYSPDGTRIAAGGTDGVVRIHDAATGRELCALIGHKAHVWALAFSPDGRQLASGGGDNAVRLWELGVKAQCQVVLDHGDTVTAVAFSHDGGLLLSAEAKRASLWESRTGRRVRSIEGVSLVAAFSADDQHVALIGISQSRRFEVASGRNLDAKSVGDEANWTTAVTPDAAHAVTRMVDGRMILWDTQTGRHVLKLSERALGPTAFSTDGRILVGSDDQGDIAVVEGWTGRTLLKLRRPCPRIASIAVAPDGRTAATGLHDGTVLVWNLVPTELPREFESAWASLADSDATKAYKARWAVVSLGDKAAALLGERLTAPDERIAGLVARLDDDAVEAREKAAVELSLIGPPAAAAVATAAAGMSADGRAKSESLLAELADPARSRGTLRRLRAIGILELMAARDALTVLARAGASETERREAAAALGRMRR